MPTWLQWTMIIMGVGAIAFLGVFITRQLRTIRRDQSAAAKSKAFQDQRRDGMVESIQVLAMAVEQDQIEYSEACLRIKGLLEHVAPDLLSQAPYRIFQEMHEQMQHMPTHQARQDTDSKFVQKMDKERFALEQKHADTIRRAATAIRHHRF
ncbi:DUF2489 domain-containing protein [Marinobacter caseinilyticus]|uniref:DUF2489 domain-containing protein n=1 Tax=Marinobacter caseinilyticus TaxID=2692195 RepID=UPI00140DE114|nr:DUF2489 domain-containing protein [Marinobacter caseinilyticus]